MNDELFEKLAALQWQIKKRRLRRFAETGPLGDTTRGQGRILAFLKMRDGVSARDLSYLLGISVSSTNELLVKLEKNGLITREPSDDDKRVILIWLTEEGKNAQQPETASAEDIFGCLSETERGSLGAILDKVIESLREEGDDDFDVRGQLQNAWQRFSSAVDGRFDRRGPFDRRGGEGFRSHDPRGDCDGRGRGDFPGHGERDGHGGHGERDGHGGHGGR